MATISFSYETTQANVTRAIAGVAGQHNYQDEIEYPNDPEQMIPNPESKAQFARRMLKRWIIENVKAYEANAAAQTSRQAVIDSVESEVILT